MRPAGAAGVGAKASAAPRASEPPRVAELTDRAVHLETPIAPSALIQLPSTQAKPRRGAALVEAQIAALEGARKPRRVDGLAYVREVLAEIARIKAEDPDRKCVVSFDLDNTVFETRARTLEICRRWDREHGTSHFARLGVFEVGLDGRDTCERAGLDPELTARFHAHWREAFWVGENFLDDMVIEEVAELAWKAKEAGAEVRYLTGRVDREWTSKELVAAGLPDPEQLYTKPSLEARTTAYKARILEEWRDEGVFLGWFITEGRRDLSELEKADPTLPLVRLDHPLETDLSHTLSAAMPVLPARLLRALRPIQ